MGAQCGLYAVAQCLLDPGDEVIYVRYGFSLYEIAAQRCGW